MINNQGDNTVFRLAENEAPADKTSAVIKVVGVGGGGGNALEYMIEHHIENVEFICANTDVQDLESSSATKSLRLGSNLTNGLGAGCNPEVGREAAMEDREKLQDILSGADMVFIAAGMGGGTGTGAAPIIAEIARASGSLTIAVVTTPFAVEGPKRMDIARRGIDALKQHIDSMITIPNEKLSTIFNEATMLEAFSEANKVLYSAVQGIAEVITCKGMVNLDFADVKTIMSGTGLAMIGTGSSSGEGRAYEATNSAINNPLMEDVALSNASGLLVNITSGPNLKMSEYQEIGNCMRELASADADVAIGTVVDPGIEDEIRVTLIATGFNDETAEQSPPPTSSAPPETPKVSVLPRGDKPGDYDSPAIGRKPPTDNVNQTTTEVDSNQNFQNYLDIPAFLRQQVD